MLVDALIVRTPRSDHVFHDIRVTVICLMIMMMMLMYDDDDDVMVYD